MIVLKASFWFLVCVPVSLFIVGCAAFVGLYLIIKAICECIWNAVFPTKLAVNSQGKLIVFTDEDRIDLNNYYKGKINITGDGIDWAGIRP